MVVEEGKNNSHDANITSNEGKSQIDRSSSSRRFINAGDAIKELFEGFNDWSANVSTHGMHTAYAVIAANWAVYGDAQAIIGNLWAKFSIAIIISFLGLNLFCTWLMTLCYTEQYDYADEDRERWSSEFEREKIVPSSWPYTKFIEQLGEFMRLLKVWAPIIGGIFFILGLFFGNQANTTIPKM